MAKKKKVEEFDDKPVPLNGNAPHNLTVNELIEELLSAKARGLGNRKILLSDDDEGNGYHKMFFSVTEITDDLLYGVHLMESKEKLKKEFVVLG